jgi:hypothetical protein
LEQNFFKGRNLNGQKKCSPSLAIKEMQIKTALRFYLILVGIIIIKNTTNKKCWQRYRGKRSPHTLLVEGKLVQLLWKTIWRLLKKLNIGLPYDPAIPLLGIYPKECDSGYSKGNCTSMFIAALFTIVNSRTMETAKMPHYRRMD